MVKVSIAKIRKVAREIAEEMAPPGLSKQRIYTELTRQAGGANRENLPDGVPRGIHETECLPFPLLFAAAARKPECTLADLAHLLWCHFCRSRATAFQGELRTGSWWIGLEEKKQALESELASIELKAATTIPTEAIQPLHYVPAIVVGNLFEKRTDVVVKVTTKGYSNGRLRLSLAWDRGSLGMEGQPMSVVLLSHPGAEFMGAGVADPSEGGGERSLEVELRPGFAEAAEHFVDVCGEQAEAPFRFVLRAESRISGASKGEEVERH